MEAVKAFVGGSDILVSMPTGYGKSVIYAVLPFVFDTLRCEFELFNYVVYIHQVHIRIYRYRWQYNCVY